eukprot:2842062-Pyramimonas_sp.AAC.1
MDQRCRPRWRGASSRRTSSCGSQRRRDRQQYRQPRVEHPPLSEGWCRRRAFRTGPRHPETQAEVTSPGAKFDNAKAKKSS